MKYPHDRYFANSASGNHRPTMPGEPMSKTEVLWGMLGVVLATLFFVGLPILVVGILVYFFS